MKKCYIPVVMLLVLISVALAEEIDEKTKSEVRIMSYPFGAKVRMLQLERALTKNILMAEFIISNLNGTNTTELLSVLDEMKILKQEIQNISYDQNASALAEHFIDLKKDSTELSKDFKDKLYVLVSPEQLSELKQKLASLRENMTEINEEVRNMVHEYNEKRVDTIVNKTCAVRNQIASKIKSGEVNATGIMLGIRNMCNKTEDKNAVIVRIRNMTAEKNSFCNMTAEKAIKNFEIRKVQRLEKRVQLIGTRNAVMQQRLNSRITAIRTGGATK